jgi:hypothetical protein
VSSLHGYLIAYGADFFGQPVFRLETLVAAINASILGFILYKVFCLRHAIKRPNIHSLSLPRLWLAFFACLMALVFLVYTSSTLAAADSYRFFIVSIYASVTFIVAILSLSKHAAMKFIVSTLLVAGTLFNLHTVTLTKNVAEQPYVAGNVGNTVNSYIINVIRSTGLEKGYGSYWHGNINTYLSNGRITFLPTLCENGETLQFHWLIDGGDFDRPANRTFYLIDPDIPLPPPIWPPTCNEKELKAQFGEPEQTLKLHNKTILVFDYDLLSRMKVYVPKSPYRKFE